MNRQARFLAHIPGTCWRPWSLCGVKWLVPGFMFCVSAFASMWWLHVGTFYYIHEMERAEHVYIINKTAAALYDKPFLSPGLSPRNVSYGSLNDPLEAKLGWQQIDMSTLDKISALLPVAWFILTILTDDMVLWTRMILCNCFLLIGKGLFGMMTIVPDSIGWASCKARLTPEGIQQLKDVIADPSEGFFPVLWSTMRFEINSHLPWTGVKSTRFCADMMYSGHTFFTCLYALALIELCRQHIPKDTAFVFWCVTKRDIIITLVYIFCILEQVVEISFVVMDRFHYVMDVAMAILLTLLFFTNGTIAIAAKTWAHWEGHLKTLFFPHHVNAEMKDKLDKLPPEVKAWADSEKGKNYFIVAGAARKKSGDIWTPFCCFPLCCFWGSTHVVEDRLMYQPNMGDESDDESLAGPTFAQLSSRETGLL